MTGQQEADRHAPVFNALTRGLAVADRFVSLNEREAITTAILNALDPDAVTHTEWAAMSIDGPGRLYVTGAEIEARALVAMTLERGPAGPNEPGRVFLTRRDTTTGSGGTSVGPWVTVDMTPEEVQAALQDAPYAWCRQCSRLVTRTHLARHQAERHGGTS